MRRRESALPSSVICLMMMMMSHRLVMIVCARVEPDARAGGCRCVSVRGGRAPETVTCAGCGEMCASVCAAEWLSDVAHGACWLFAVRPAVAFGPCLGCA